MFLSADLDEIRWLLVFNDSCAWTLNPRSFDSEFERHKTDWLEKVLHSLGFASRWTSSGATKRTSVFLSDLTSREFI